MRGRASKLYFFAKKKEEEKSAELANRKGPSSSSPCLDLRGGAKEVSFHLSLSLFHLFPLGHPTTTTTSQGQRTNRSPFLFLSLVPKIPDFSEFHSFRVWGKGRSERRKATFHSRRPSPSLSPLSPFLHTFGEGELEHLPSTGSCFQAPQDPRKFRLQCSSFLLAATSLFFQESLPIKWMCHPLRL